MMNSMRKTFGINNEYQNLPIFMVVFPLKKKENQSSFLPCMNNAG